MFLPFKSACKLISSCRKLAILPSVSHVFLGMELKFIDVQGNSLFPLNGLMLRRLPCSSIYYQS